MQTLSFLDTHSLIAITTLCLASVAQLYFYLQYYLRTLSLSENDTLIPSQGISIVLYADHNLELLQAHLPAFLSQKHPCFELIIVNDGSSTQMEDYIQALSQQYDNIYYTYLSDDARNLSRKKMTLTLGIKAARYDWICLSDVACQPLSDHWLTTCEQAIQLQQASFAIGPVVWNKKNESTDLFVQLDKLLYNLRMLAYGQIHRPYGTVNSNLFFEKSLFFKHKGFAKQMHLLAGEDILWIELLRKTVKGVTLTHPHSTLIKQRDAYTNYWKQEKQIHAFTRQFASTLPTLIFSIENLSRYMYYGAALYCIYLAPNIELKLLFAVAILLRMISVAIFWYKAARKYLPTSQYTSFLAFELLYPIVDLGFRIHNLWTKKKYYTWRI